MTTMVIIYGYVYVYGYLVEDRFVLQGPGVVWKWILPPSSSSLSLVQVTAFSRAIPAGNLFFVINFRRARLTKASYSTALPRWDVTLERSSKELSCLQPFGAGKWTLPQEGTGGCSEPWSPPAAVIPSPPLVVVAVNRQMSSRLSLQKQSGTWHTIFPVTYS